MTSDVVKNVTIELADPQNPQIDPEIVPLLLLELILAQLNQSTQLKKDPGQPVSGTGSLRVVSLIPMTWASSSHELTNFSPLYPKKLSLYFL